jgi:hypothetical protein
MQTHFWPRAVTCARIAALSALFAALAPSSGEAAIAVTLTWERSPDPNTAGYYVYWGLESNNYTTGFNAGNTTSAVISLPDPSSPSAKYFLAVQAYSTTGERSPFSPETVFTAAQLPILRNPGAMTGVVGLTVSMQLSATDPSGSALIYSAGGLPRGIAVSSTTGRISGTPTTAGSYNVTVAATNTSGISAIQFFNWSIVGPTSGGGTPGTTPAPPASNPGSGISNPPPSSGNPGGGISNPPPSSGNPGGIPTPPPSSGNPGGGPGTAPLPSPGPGADFTPPTVVIASPATDGYRTPNSKLIVTGTASDNVGVVLVTWANNRGGAGTALGTSSWATSPIDLKMGDNIVTITVSDAAGNVQAVAFTVTRYVDLENHLN